MGNLKKTAAANAAARGKTKDSEPSDGLLEPEADDGWWRVLLLRGLVSGDLEGTSRFAVSVDLCWLMAFLTLLVWSFTCASGGEARSGAH